MVQRKKITKRVNTKSTDSTPPEQDQAKNQDAGQEEAQNEPQNENQDVEDEVVEEIIEEIVVVEEQEVDIESDDQQNGQEQDDQSQEKDDLDETEDPENDENDLELFDQKTTLAADRITNKQAMMVSLANRHSEKSVENLVKSDFWQTDKFLRKTKLEKAKHLSKLARLACDLVILCQDPDEKKPGKMRYFYAMQSLFLDYPHIRGMIMAENFRKQNKDLQELNGSSLSTGRYVILQLPMAAADAVRIHLTELCHGRIDRQVLNPDNKQMWEQRLCANLHMKRFLSSYKAPKMKMGKLANLLGQKKGGLVLGTLSEKSFLELQQEFKKIDILLVKGAWQNKNPRSKSSLKRPKITYRENMPDTWNGKRVSNLTEEEHTEMSGEKWWTKVLTCNEICEKYADKIGPIKISNDPQIQKTLKQKLRTLPIDGYHKVQLIEEVFKTKKLQLENAFEVEGLTALEKNYLKRKIGDPANPKKQKAQAVQQKKPSSIKKPVDSRNPPKKAGMKRSIESKNGWQQGGKRPNLNQNTGGPPTSNSGRPFYGGAMQQNSNNQMITMTPQQFQQNMQMMQNMQNMQNIQNMQNMQNMQQNRMMQPQATSNQQMAGQGQFQQQRGFPGNNMQQGQHVQQAAQQNFPSQQDATWRSRI